MIPLAIAGLQMAVSAEHENVSRMRQQLDIVMGRYPWVQMVLFSELAPHGPLSRYAQPLPNAAEAVFQEMAAKYEIWLLPGSQYERGPHGEIYNTASVINPSGEVAARYRKMFPFRPYEEGIAPGTSFCVFDVPAVGRFGVSICYDIWFPETTRTLTAMGAEVLLHPVLTGSIDREVELSIARATAAQFQCYVFDINGVGAGGVGRSCVIDPAGHVLHQAGGEEEIIPIEIDLTQVRRQREIGIRGLGQVLKSFRDRPTEFSVYHRSAGLDSYLGTLGPLRMPVRGAGAGLDLASSPLVAAAQAAPTGGGEDTETAATDRDVQVMPAAQ
ncbi:MAG TPA: carbon-nitrogen hydrolase family protein [Alphaproteobacteria bacterium]|nr:carbon-nitrogen hydrolase family protein [Alphaproteobacteria bacterium]